MILKKIRVSFLMLFDWLMGLGEGLYRAICMLAMAPVIPFLIPFTVLKGIFQKDGNFWKYTLFPLKTVFDTLYKGATTGEPPRLRWVFGLAFIAGVIFLIL